MKRMTDINEPFRVKPVGNDKPTASFNDIFGRALGNSVEQNKIHSQIGDKDFEIKAGLIKLI